MGRGGGSRAAPARRETPPARTVPRDGRLSRTDEARKEGRVCVEGGEAGDLGDGALLHVPVQRGDEGIGARGKHGGERGGVDGGPAAGRRRRALVEQSQGRGDDGLIQPRDVNGADDSLGPKERNFGSELQRPLVDLGGLGGVV